MEEFIHSHRRTRRLAILAIVCCSSAQLCASDAVFAEDAGTAVAKESAKANTSLRSLLTQGFDNSTAPVKRPLPSSNGPEGFADFPMPEHPLERPQRPVSLTPMTKARTEVVSADAAKPSSLAEVLQRKAKIMVVPQLSFAPESTQSAPVVNRLKTATAWSMLPSDVDPVALAQPVEFPPASMSELLKLEVAPQKKSAEIMPQVTAAEPTIPTPTTRPTPSPVPFARPAAPSGTTAPPPAMAIHANRLRELAQVAIRDAKQSLQRRAIHSARKHTLEALQLTIDRQDAVAGGNQHAKRLAEAMTAIRESKDFCGRFGVVDPQTLERLVSVHETPALKGLDVSNLSSIEATETYLSLARQALVDAADGSRETCEALILWGLIEKELAGESDTHAGAVALTLHRAAVEVMPTSSLANRQLGNTLLEQGLVQHASWAFRQSIQLRPSRAAYQKLLEASRQMGDVTTARQCLRALDDPGLASEIAVRTLDPQTFASSYRPSASSLPAATAKPQAPVPATASESKVTARSFFSFGRR